MPFRVCIVVLGDYGRSPRMRYHSLSLAKEGHYVDVISYGGTKLPSSILSNSNISLHPIKEFSNLGSYCPRLIAYFIKTILLSFNLFLTLCLITKPNFILIQNPPSIPTLPVIWLYSLIRNIRLIIDWHNYGFTILRLTLGNNHLLVKLCRWCEGFFGSMAYHHICVSKAMKNDLKLRWNINATVFYDRPPSIFKPLDLHEKHELFLKLSKDYNVFGYDGLSNFTKINSLGFPIENEDRPFLIITSTSWSEDEDFDILFKSLESIELSNSNVIPDIVCVITGKGPLQSYYKKLIFNKIWKKVKFAFVWLDDEDYAKLIAASDVGICLHKSSSNLDLPMKIVDMFGCCLPVIAYDYECIRELVTEGENGFIFSDSDDLKSNILKLCKNFGNNVILKRMRENLQNNRGSEFDWDHNWKQIIKPIFVH